MSDDEDTGNDNVIDVPQFRGPGETKRPRRNVGTRRERVSVRPSERQREIWDPDFDVSTLDDEELVRGRRRDKNGNFTGPGAKALPASFHRRAMQELFRRADDQLRKNLVECTSTLTSIATDTTIDPAVRARTAQWVIERVMGKTPEVIHVGKEDPWGAALEGVVADAEDENIRKANIALNNQGE